MFQKQLTITGHSGAVYCCCVHEGFIYSGSADHYVTRWNIETGEQDKFAVKFEHSIYSIEIIENNLLVVGLSSGGIHVFDLSERKEIKFFTQHTKAVFSLKFNPLKHQLFAADAEGNLSVWNTLDLSLMIYLPLDCGKIRRMSVTNSGDYIALACQDGNLRILDTDNFNEIHTINAHKDGATSVLFHSNQELLLSGGKDALIKVWNWRKEELIETIVAHNFAVYDLVELLENDVFISASRDKKMKVWNSNNFEFIERLEIKNGGHKHSVNSLSRINENTFVSCSDDKQIIVWKAVNE